MFNLWRRYPKRKPKEVGYYLCTIKYEPQNYVAELYFDDIEDGIWIDRGRQQVFDGYKVYKPGRATIEEHRVFEDSLCVIDNVIAWKKKPKRFGWWKE